MHLCHLAELGYIELMYLDESGGCVAPVLQAIAIAARGNKNPLSKLTAENDG